MSDNETIYVGPPSTDELSITPAPPLESSKEEAVEEPEQATNPQQATAPDHAADPEQATASEVAALYQQAAGQIDMEHVEHTGESVSKNVAENVNDNINVTFTEVTARTPKTATPGASSLPILTRSTSVRPEPVASEPEHAPEPDMDEAAGEEVGIDSLPRNMSLVTLRRTAERAWKKCARGLRRLKRDQGGQGDQRIYLGQSSAGQKRGQDGTLMGAQWAEMARRLDIRGLRPGRHLARHDIGGMQELGRYLASAEHVVSLAGHACDGARYSVFIIDVDNEHRLLRAYDETMPAESRHPGANDNGAPCASPTASAGNSSQAPPRSETASAAARNKHRFISLHARKMIESALQSDEAMQRDGVTRVGAHQRLQARERRRSDTFDGPSQKRKDRDAGNAQHQVYSQVAEVMRKLANRELSANPGIDATIWNAAVRRANVEADHQG